MRWARSTIASGKLEHSLARSCCASASRVDALRFGRKGASSAKDAATAEARSPLLSSDDLRLFFTTFATGFIFVGVLIA
jgi:hypothetical protein